MNRYDERWQTADGAEWVNAAKHDALAARWEAAEAALSEIAAGDEPHAARIAERGLRTADSAPAAREG